MAEEIGKLWSEAESLVQQGSLHEAILCFLRARNRAQSEYKDLISNPNSNQRTLTIYTNLIEKLNGSINRNISILEKNPIICLNLPSAYTKKDVKKAYRKQALKYHPDKNTDCDTSILFAAIQSAHECLSISAPNGPATIPNEDVNTKPKPDKTAKDTKKENRPNNHQSFPQSEPYPSSTSRPQQQNYSTNKTTDSQSNKTEPTSSTNGADTKPKAKANKSRKESNESVPDKGSLYPDASTLSTDELRELVRQFGFLRIDSMHRGELLKKYLAVKAHLDAAHASTNNSSNANNTKREFHGVDAGFAKAWANEMKMEMDRDRDSQRAKQREAAAAKKAKENMSTAQDNSNKDHQQQQQQQWQTDRSRSKRDVEADLQRTERAGRLLRDLPRMSVAELRVFVNASGLSDAGCIEKQDLLDILYLHFGINVPAATATATAANVSHGAKRNSASATSATGNVANSGTGTTGISHDKTTPMPANSTTGNAQDKADGQKGTRKKSGKLDLGGGDLPLPKLDQRMDLNSLRKVMQASGVPVCTDRDKDKGRDRDRDRDRASQAANGFHNNYMADEMGFGGVRMGFGEWTEEEIKDFAPFHSFPLPPYTNAFPQQQQQQQYSHVMTTDKLRALESKLHGKSKRQSTNNKRDEEESTVGNSPRNTVHNADPGTVTAEYDITSNFEHLPTTTTTPNSTTTTTNSTPNSTTTTTNSTPNSTTTTTNSTPNSTTTTTNSTPNSSTTTADVNNSNLNGSGENINDNNSSNYYYSISDINNENISYHAYNNHSKNSNNYVNSPITDIDTDDLTSSSHNDIRSATGATGATSTGTTSTGTTINDDIPLSNNTGDPLRKTQSSEYSTSGMFYETRFVLVDEPPVFRNFNVPLSENDGGETGADDDDSDINYRMEEGMEIRFPVRGFAETNDIGDADAGNTYSDDDYEDEDEEGEGGDGIDFPQPQPLTERKEKAEGTSAESSEVPYEDLSDAGEEEEEEDDDEDPIEWSVVRGTPAETVLNGLKDRFSCSRGGGATSSLFDTEGNAKVDVEVFETFPGQSVPVVVAAAAAVSLVNPSSTLEGRDTELVDDANRYNPGNSCAEISREPSSPTVPVTVGMVLLLPDSDEDEDEDEEEEEAEGTTHDKENKSRNKDGSNILPTIRNNKQLPDLGSSYRSDKEKEKEGLHHNGSSSSNNGMQPTIDSFPVLPTLHKVNKFHISRGGSDNSSLPNPGTAAAASTSATTKNDDHVHQKPHSTNSHIDGTERKRLTSADRLRRDAVSHREVSEQLEESERIFTQQLQHQSCQQTSLEDVKRIQEEVDFWTNNLQNT